MLICAKCGLIIGERSIIGMDGKEYHPSCRRRVYYENERKIRMKKISEMRCDSKYNEIYCRINKSGLCNLCKL